jgi:hypothetical protein
MSESRAGMLKSNRIEHTASEIGLTEKAQRGQILLPRQQCLPHVASYAQLNPPFIQVEILCSAQSPSAVHFTPLLARPDLSCLGTSSRAGEAPSVDAQSQMARKQRMRDVHLQRGKQRGRLDCAALAGDMNRCFDVLEFPFAS